MVLLKGAGGAAADWHRFLLSPPAQAVFVRHGYALPQSSGCALYDPTGGQRFTHTCLVPVITPHPMDWSALHVSLTLAALTTLALLPVGLALARWLAVTAWAGRPVVEALLLLPLLLPPTVIGFYFLVALGQGSALGAWLAASGIRLVFTLEGLLLVSVLVNLPFMVQPIQRAFAAVPHSLREAAWVSGLSTWQTFWRIELPLAWPGLLAGMALTVAHTLGEFGVVLMVGGNIEGETRTLSVSLYDKVQGMDLQSAHVMALALVGVSLLALTLVLAFDRVGQRGRALQER
jgi:molybdate transport system permease protein